MASVHNSAQHPVIQKTSRRFGMSVTDDRFTSEKKFGIFRAYERAQLSRVMAGEAYWNIGQQRYHVREGDLILCSPVDLRQFEQLPTGSELHLRTLRYQSSQEHMADMNVYYLRPPGFSNLLPRDHPQFAHVDQLFLQITDCIRRGENPLDEAFIHAAISLMNVYLRYIYEPCLPNVAKKQHQLLVDACRYVSDHLEEDLSAETIARSLYCTPSHLSRTFHRLSGIRLSDHIRRVRVAAVIRCLRHSDTSVLDAAFSCGFRSASGFYKAFHAETGMSPNDYINQ